jgi:two-component system, cell cycle response regulator
MTKVLAVDDKKDNLDLLSQILEDGNYQVLTAINGKDAIALAEREIPDVILLDVQLPEMDGFEVCRILKQKDATKDIPVIFLTAYRSGDEQVVKGLDVGAYDYITKPYSDNELLARVGVMVRIRDTEKKIEEMSLTDFLTNLYNRRYLYKKFEEEISRAQRGATPLSCMMLDIDFFKKVNDTYGHDFGDFVLIEMANILRNNLRVYDIITRIGGEEFMVVLPSTDLVNAKIAAKKIREKVEEYDFKKDEKAVKLTVSIGVFGCPGNQIVTDVDKYIKYADQALYNAKFTGRNRVVAFGKRGDSDE